MTSTTDSDERRDDSPKPAEAHDGSAEAGDDSTRGGREAAAPEAGKPAQAKALDGAAPREEARAVDTEDALREDARADVAVAEEPPDGEAYDEGAPDEDGKRPLSPSQARSLRMRVAGTFMAIAAVVLVVRLSDQPSVLVMGVYGAALILCGVVIELSRRGRTRLGMWMLAGGLVAVALADQWLRSG
ncbi:hypothetical protein [Streptomyces meridianus]|uniref:Uncharacterized protein n=1 Tax=Streptomyces meridianus TaxID=2938945 RepID=A0ABT0XBT9_9ACTN|nr:hypothetical protein [Streptomyces meridianus]MCM2579845.1 hypothetical protein [Streptomyces meridianus]